MYISVDNEETSSEEFIKLATESKEKCIVVQKDVIKPLKNG